MLWEKLYLIQKNPSCINQRVTFYLKYNDLKRVYLNQVSKGQYNTYYVSCRRDTFVYGYSEATPPSTCRQTRRLDVS